jgi:hypothetical protein
VTRASRTRRCFSDWIGLTCRHAVGRRGDPKNRELGGDPLELRQLRVMVYGQVRPGSRRDREVATQDGRPVGGLDFLEAYLLAAATARPSAARTLRTQLALLPSIDTRYCS